MRIIGFDSSSVITGWAVIEDGPAGSLTLLKAGRIVLREHDPIGARLCDLEEMLSAILMEVKPDRVCYEDVYVRFIKSAAALFKVLGVIEKLAYGQLHIRAEAVRVSSIRKLLDCSSKQGVRNIIERTFNIKITDDLLDVSDAIAVTLAAHRLPVKKKKERRKRKCTGRTTEETPVDA